nr:FeoA family protein [uncultured Methanoregula sp.]
MNQNQINESPKTIRNPGTTDRFVTSGIPAITPEKKILPLTDVHPGQGGQIAFIHGDGAIARRLADLGLTPGTAVSLLRKIPMNGPVEIEVRRTKLALEPPVAGTIFIEFSYVGEP